MKFRTIIVILSTSLFSISAQAGIFEDACEQLLGDTNINLQITPVTVEAVSQEFTVSELTKAHYKGENPGSQLIAGHTKIAWLSRSGTKLSAMIHPQSGLVCYRPSIVQLQLGFAPIQVYVASEYDKESCSYQAVLGHEMEHVRIYKDNLPGKAEGILKSMANKIGRTVRYSNSIESAKKEMDEYVQTTFHSLTLIANDEVQEIHNQFDSPEESHRMANSCGGLVRSTIQFSALARN